MVFRQLSAQGTRYLSNYLTGTAVYGWLGMSHVFDTSPRCKELFACVRSAGGASDVGLDDIQVKVGVPRSNEARYYIQHLELHAQIYDVVKRFNRTKEAGDQNSFLLQEFKS